MIIKVAMLKIVEDMVNKIIVEDMVNKIIVVDMVNKIMEHLNLNSLLLKKGGMILFLQNHVILVMVQTVSRETEVMIRMQEQLKIKMVMEIRHPNQIHMGQDQIRMCMGVYCFN
jgi:hypothetical protein